MPIDQSINYRVNIDDANFQAKLTQMRASLDQTMMGGGMSGMMGMGMGGPGYFARMGSIMGMGATPGGGMDFSIAAPQSYTPPGIAMTPHFGMYAVRQTFSQQLANSMGVASFNPFSTRRLPDEITPNELGTVSARAMGDRVADVASSGMMTGLNLGVSTVGGILGAAAGTAVGGPLGGLIGGVLGGVSGSKMISGVEEGVTQNRAIQTDLQRASFRFITGGNDVDPQQGRGFSRSARLRAAEDLQMMAARDERFNITEMREIQNLGIDKGLFAGRVTDTNSLEDETRKLKENIKNITQTLHMSIKEAGDTLQSLKSMGIVDDQTRNRMIMSAEVQGRMSGRTGQEMMVQAQVGASIFQGTGVRMGLGGETQMQATTLVRQMLNQGTLSQEAVAQAGGEEALAQQMTAGGLSATQNQFGRAMLMANFDPKTGKLRADWRERIAKGDAMQMVQDAAKLDPADQLKFSAHEEEIKSQMTAADMMVIPAAQMRARARTLMDATRQGGKSLTEDEAFVAAAKQAGWSWSQIQASRGIMKTDMGKIAQEEAGTEAVVALNTQSAQARDALSYKAVIGNTLEQASLSFSNAIVETANTVGEKTENFINRTRNKVMVLGLEAQGKPVPGELRAASEGTAPVTRGAAAAAQVMQDVARENRAGVSNAGVGVTGPSAAQPAPATKAATAGGHSADSVTLETQKHIDTMSRQLMNNYQQLINMQKELNALMPRSK